MNRTDFWTERDAWPFVKPGYVFLPDVFDRIGEAMFGAAWTGEEGTLKPNGPRPSKPSLIFETFEVAGSPKLFRRIKDSIQYNREERRIASILGLTEMQRLAGISFEQWAEAVDRWLAADLAGPSIRDRIRAVYAQMHLSAAADELKFYVPDVRNGHMMPIREGDWNFDKEVVYPRFDRCSMNLDREFIFSRPPSDMLSEQRYLRGFLHPMFVEKARLESIAPLIGRRYRGELDNEMPETTSTIAATSVPGSSPIESDVKSNSLQPDQVNHGSERAEASTPFSDDPSMPVKPDATKPSVGRKRKTKSWEPNLMRLFKLHHDAIVPLSDRSLLDFVLKKWPEHLREKPQSATTLRKYWHQYLSERSASTE